MSLFDLVKRGPAKGAYPQIIAPPPELTLPGYRAHRVFESGPRAGGIYPVMIGKENAETALSQRILMQEWLKSQYIPFGMAPRQGWHAGELPYGPQFNVGGKDPGKRFGRLQPDDVVYSRVSLGADNNVSGYLNPQDRGIVFDEKIKLPFDQTQLPEGGMYAYRPSGYADPWLVSDKVWHEKLLTDEEIADIFRTAGREPPPPRASKPVTEGRLRELGLLGAAPVAAGLGALAGAPGEAQAASFVNDYTRSGEMRAAPRGDFSGWLADILGGAKGWMNQAQVPQGVPLVGGMGAGDLTMGQAPELMDSMSYGFSPVRGAGMAATLDPAVMDLLGLMAPAAGRAGAVARGMPGVVRQAALDAYGPAVNMARPRYTLGGKEVGRGAIQQELGLALPVDEIKQAMREAKNARARRRYEQKRSAEREFNWTPADAFGSRATLGSNDNLMSQDELLRLILERGKTLPNPETYSIKR